ncbi:hypothetical protein C1H46_044731 [Malus baccata]|uniref:Sugar phosphate transporter domain-containing protein n=1 Tax=Malus baccata TaxID=106549 RepID=A0A540K677_MALBA|nr:hypothetical protein C1H46_044731 [Malus baccata]
MYYVSPCSALCLFIPWIFLEKSKMEENSSWNFPLLVLTLNSLCTFALNLSVFLVITHTSALTIRVAGVVKDWVVVLLSAIIFADTKLTPINLAGYAIAAPVAGKYCDGLKQNCNSRSKDGKFTQLYQHHRGTYSVYNFLDDLYSSHSYRCMGTYDADSVQD